MCWHPSWLPLILAKTFRGHAWTPRRSAWSSASLMGCWTARLCIYVCNKTLSWLRTMTPRRSWATSLSLRRRSSHATELGDSHRSSKQGSFSCLTRPTPWNWLVRRWWAEAGKAPHVLWYSERLQWPLKTRKTQPSYSCVRRGTLTPDRAHNRIRSPT